MVERALRYEPVLDRRGNPTGEFTYTARLAIKGLELIGKHLGMSTGKGQGEARLKHEDWVEILSEQGDEEAYSTRPVT